MLVWDDLIQFDTGIQVSKLRTADRERRINRRCKRRGVGRFANPVGVLLAKTQSKPGIESWSIRSRDERVVSKTAVSDPERREGRIQVAVHLCTAGAVNGMPGQRYPHATPPHQI